MRFFHHSAYYQAELPPVEGPREGLMQDMELENKALWALLKENTDLTEEDLIRKKDEIRHSGSYRPEDVHKCPQCGAEIPWTGTHCQFCGYKLTSEDMAAQESLNNGLS